MFTYVKHHAYIIASPELAVNGGAVTSFVCSCLLNCFVATDRHHCCTNQSSTKPDRVLHRGLQSCNDVIFNYVTIEMASSDNPGVRITGSSNKQGSTCTYVRT